MAKKKNKKDFFDLNNIAKKIKKKKRPMAKININILQKEVKEDMEKNRRSLV